MEERVEFRRKNLVKSTKRYWTFPTRALRRTKRLCEGMIKWNKGGSHKRRRAQFDRARGKHEESGNQTRQHDVDKENQQRSANRAKGEFHAQAALTKTGSTDRKFRENARLGGRPTCMRD